MTTGCPWAPTWRHEDRRESLGQGETSIQGPRMGFWVSCVAAQVQHLALVDVAHTMVSAGWSGVASAHGASSAFFS